MNETRTGLDVIIVLITLAAFTLGGGAGILYLVATGATDGAVSHVIPLVTFSLGAVAGVLARTTRTDARENITPVEVTNSALNPVPTVERGGDDDSTLAQS